MNKLRIYWTLLKIIWKYKIKVTPFRPKEVEKGNCGCFWYESMQDVDSAGYITKDNQIWNTGIFVDLTDKNRISILLHELGHMTHLYRRYKSSTKGSYKAISSIYSELRASRYAVLVGNKLGLIAQQDKDFLLRCYEGYVQNISHPSCARGDYLRGARLLGVKSPKDSFLNPRGDYGEGVWINYGELHKYEENV